jgi:hypothetical protein
MKATAIILVGCMLLLSIGNLLDNIKLAGENTEMCCCADSSSGCCDSEEDQHDSNVPCNADQDCPPTCDCSSQFQITALAYSFMESSGVTVQSYHYIRYMNTYSFEYSDNFLHPPRFG